MKIIYINNDGSGFAGQLDVQKGTTVAQFFEQQVEGKPDDYLIRVNRQSVTPNYVLQENDRVSFTPMKIQGA